MQQALVAGATVLAALALSAQGAGSVQADAEPSPMFGKQRLIAGSGDSGYVDGNFIRAQFRGPTGLALSPDGNILYIADSGNHAVRSVRLDSQNKVATLLGDGKAGDGEGPAGGRLSSPRAMALSHDGGRLYVGDEGNGKIKVLELKTGALSTAFHVTATALAVGPTLGLLFAIDSIEGALYASGPGGLDMRKLLVDPVLVGQGAALAFVGKDLRVLAGIGHKVYGISDSAAEELDEADFKGLSEGAKVSLVFKYEMSAHNGLASMGQVSKHVGLITWDDGTAAFQLYENPLAFQSTIVDAGQVLRSAPTAGLAATSPAFRSYFGGPLELAYDAKRNLVYVAERSSNRIFCVRDDSQTGLKRPFFNNIDFPKEKAPGVERILFFGSSMQFFSKDEGHVPGKTMMNHFELYLNALSATNGTGKQYEVIHSTSVGRSIGAGEAYLPEHAELLAQYHFDHVIFPMDDRSVWWDIWAWKSVETKDDVPLRSEDPEWALKPYKEKAAALGPVTKKMHQLCRKDPTACGGQVSFSAEGEASASAPCEADLYFFEVPVLLNFSLQIEAKIGARLVEVCKRAGVKPWAFLVPTKDYFMVGAENDNCRRFDNALPKALEETLRAQGMEAFDLLEPVRLLQPQLFPLWSKKDGHFTHRGLQWVGFIMAQKFLELEAQKK